MSPAKKRARGSDRSWIEECADDVPPIKVQRRILNLVNEAKRPKDLVRRFRIGEKDADQIVEGRHRASPYGFHAFEPLWEILDRQLRITILEWFRHGLRGEWLEPIDIPHELAHHEAPVHAALLKNGNVLLIPHSHDFEGLAVTYVWDPTSSGAAAFNETDNQPTDNLYCSGHAFMSDGRLFVAGGGGASSSGALDACWIFDPEEGQHGVWTKIPETMAYKRWYPTVLTLGGGDILIVGGKPNDDKIEVFHESPSSSDRFETVFVNPDVDFNQTYPGLHLLPNGQVFNSPTGFADAGTDTYTGSMPEDGRLLTLDSSGCIDLPWPFSDLFCGFWTGSWETLTSQGAAPMDSPKRAKGMSAPIFERCHSGSFVTKVIVACGGGKDTSETVDFSSITPTWSRATIPGGPRNNANLVLLPDGKVFLLGGATSAGQAADECALYDPDENAWTEMDALTYKRAYHAVAVLLPSGQVMVTGDEESYSIEIYSPPYLFKPGPRPEIKSHPETIHHAETFEVTWSNSDRIDRAVLVRPMAVTHQTDTEQRVIEMKMTADSETLTLVAPNGDHPHPLAPRGHYLLFLINDKGVPSVGEFIFLH